MSTKLLRRYILFFIGLYVFYFLYGNVQLNFNKKHDFANRIESRFINSSSFYNKQQNCQQNTEFIFLKDGVYLKKSTAKYLIDKNLFVFFIIAQRGALAPSRMLLKIDILSNGFQFKKKIKSPFYEKIFSENNIEIWEVTTYVEILEKHSKSSMMEDIRLFYSLKYDTFGKNSVKNLIAEISYYRSSSMQKR